MHGVFFYQYFAGKGEIAMGIVVRELFAEFGAKYQMRLLAGEKGLNRVMDWVHIIQFCEKKPFLCLVFHGKFIW